MSGVRGKSGRASTFKQREVKRQQASAGGIAKSAALRNTQDSGDQPPTDSGFPVRGWIDLKDKKQCDLADRKIELADIEVEKAAAELEKIKGSLVERAKLKESVHAVRDLIYEALVQVPAKVVAAIPDLPNNYKAPLALALQAQIDAACAAAIAEAIKRHG